MRPWTVAILMSATVLAGCAEDAPQDDVLPVQEGKPAGKAAGDLPAANGTAAVSIRAEPTVDEPYQVVVATPGKARWTFTAGNGSFEGSTPGPGTFTFDAPAHERSGPVNMTWTATGTFEARGHLAFDVWGLPLEFPADPTAQHGLRPGIFSEVCTTNFIFHHKWTRLFIGSAAHCADGADADPDGCTGTEMDIGSNETLEGGITVTRAWSSWNLMNAAGVCHDANDFALFEIHPDQWDRVHPQGHGIIGDVHGLGDCRQLEPSPLGGGSSLAPDVKAYGRSPLRGALVAPTTPDDPRDDKVGKFLEADNDGFQCHVYYHSPGIPGDSGGPLATMDGLALGAASTVTIAPTTGSNHYTNIAAALAFMEEHEGWAPELVTG